MKLKVCGITDSEQFIKINELGVDMIGLNFYKPSKRYIEQFERSKEIPMHATSKRVGVFVNHSKDEILAKQESYNLDYAQLHGDEDLDFCKALNKFIKIIKVWRIKDRIEEFNQIRAFEDYVSFHLFDTYTTNYGGSGVAFNWQILNQLTLTKPFMLSGGISMDHVKQLGEQKLKNLWGVDINSKFETAPGIKDISLIERFQDKIKSL